MSEIRQAFETELEHEVITPRIVMDKLNFWSHLPRGEDYLGTGLIDGLSDSEIVDHFRHWLLNTCDLESLHHLRINMRNRESNPREIGYFTHLTELDIEYCTEPLPDEITLLTQLETLSYESGFHSSVPESVLLLPQLISLRIEAARMFEFPSELLSMNQLQNLDISHA